MTDFGGIDVKELSAGVKAALLDVAAARNVVADAGNFLVSVKDVIDTLGLPDATRVNLRDALRNSGGTGADPLATVSQVAFPVGALLAWTTVAAPVGFLLCDGLAVSRATYAALFAVIGETYGVGDGSTTFNVPDLRGRVPLGKDNMGGTPAGRVTASEADNLGEGSGAEDHTLTEAEMPSHSHSLHTGTTGSGTVTVDHATIDNAHIDTAGAIHDTGGGGAHANVQPYQTVSYIVKT